MSSVSRRKTLLWLGFSAALLPAAGCGGESARTQEPTESTRQRASPAIRVQVAPVRKGQLDVQSRATGVSRAFQRATVSAEVGGRLVERTTEAGDRVQTGTPLLQIDQRRPGLARDEARAGLRSRETDLAEAKRELARGQDLARQEALSESELDRLSSQRDRAIAALALARAGAARAEQDFADTTVRAPFAGTVERIDADVGDYIQPGTPVAVVIDLSRVRVQTGVTATEAARLREEMPVTLIFDAGDGRARAGTIRSVGRLADTRTGTYPVEIWLDNDDGTIRDGMMASIGFTTDKTLSFPLVPRAALARNGSGVIVYVVEGEGEIRRAAMREVRLGRSDQTHIEIIGGVKPGEIVITDGHFAIENGAPIVMDRAGTGS
jgi:membrane fusion protein (multidrug efflux system)